MSRSLMGIPLNLPAAKLRQHRQQQRQHVGLIANFSSTHPYETCKAFTQGQVKEQLACIDSERLVLSVQPAA